MHTSRSRRRLAATIVGLALVAAGCSGDDGDEANGDDGKETVLGKDEKGYRATIRRGEGGVPHITAENLEGLSFGQGWASGEDRTCDLADQMIKLKGERAKWFGPGEDDANILSDLAWRAIGIREVALADWEKASEGVKQLLTAYTDGWNAHLAEVGADGIDDWCAGEDWLVPLEPGDVYAYARSIALQASSGAVSSMIATAHPPGTEPVSTTTTAPTDTSTSTPEPEEPVTTTPGDDEEAAGPIEPVVASNGWAIGKDRSADGGGMLVANPHFPWEGQLRFWEVHLTIPGEVDIYGVQLSGLPGVGIGFTENFGWTHTVSAGNRFTAYRLDLVPGKPTSYRYDGAERAMTPTDITIDVLGDDGAVTPLTRTMWRSHYGPILDFPGFGWSEAGTITIRDANIENDEFIEQYLAMMQAKDLDGLIDAHRTYTGVPLFNTIAASADGRAWYADTSATPKLSDAAIAAYEASLESDPIVKIAADNGAVLLDGSDSTFEWEVVDGARDPGLVPYSEMPVVERSDYLFNANDSFWVPHATALLEGDYSPLHGRQRTPRSPRTRENATVLDDTTAAGPSGDDGVFTLDELADAALQNRGYTSRALLDDVVARCRAVGSVTVPAVPDPDGGELLPAGTVDLGPACDVLDGWDGVYDIDRAGPALWRETVGRFDNRQLSDAGPLWATPFDPASPISTPSGLAPAPGTGDDPIAVNLARAVQTLEKAGVAVDVPLGDLQAADRNGTLVPIHGGNAADGTTNVVGWGRGWSTLDPALLELEREPLAPGSSLAEVTGGGRTTTGYRVNNGTSFLLALSFTPDGPVAKAFLTYGNTANRKDPLYTEATERFSEKDWRDVAFREEDVARTTTSTVTVRG